MLALLLALAVQDPAFHVGRVLRQDGTPVAGAMVIGLDESALDNTVPVSAPWRQVATSAEDGTFELSPSTHTVLCACVLRT